VSIEQLHDLGCRLLGCTVRMVNLVMDMYVRCGDLERAKTVFGRIDNKTVVSWTRMISHCKVRDDG
jgi:pentatricopeptide repeat protein